MDVRGDGRWKKAAVDMRVDESSVIKTGKNSKVELMVDGERVAIGSETVIKVSSIIENLKARDKMSWFQKVSERFASVIGSRDDKTEMVVLNLEGRILRRVYLPLTSIQPKRGVLRYDLFVVGQEKLYELVKNNETGKWELLITNME